MTPLDALEAAIEQAYVAFAHARCPKTIEASPLRDAKAILHDLTALPLRQLGAANVRGYAAYAMTTVGTADDYRHFLPRLLELAARDADAFGTEPQVIAGKLVYGAWTNWPAAERDAVAALFGAALDVAIEQPLFLQHDAADWLCGLARLGIAPDPWLARWRTATIPNAGAQLANLVTDVIDPDDGMFTAYWEQVPPEIQQAVIAWLLEPTTRDMLVATRRLAAPDDEWGIDLALVALSHGTRGTKRH